MQKFCLLLVAKLGVGGLSKINWLIREGVVLIMPRRAKITIVGAGNVGATTAVWCAARDLGDVVLVDIPELEGVARGKALDLLQASPVIGFDSKIFATASYQDTEGSDVVVITAGFPRKPGMSREDLLSANVQIVTGIAEKIRVTSPEAVVIVVSNPLDAMVYRVWEVTGFPHHRVMGQAGILDTARFRTFIAMELGISVRDVSAMLLGGHGDTMVPVVSCTVVGGIPVTQLIPPGRLEEIVERTRNGGAEIVNLLKTGGAYYAPAAATAEMVEAILRDQKRVLPVSAFCRQEYGVGGLFIGVPVVLGAKGVERIIEIDLTPKERAAMARSISAVRKLVEQMKELCAR